MTGRCSPVTRAKPACVSWTVMASASLPAIARIDHDLGRATELFSRARALHRRPGQDIMQLNLGIAHHQAPRITVAEPDLQQHRVIARYGRVERPVLVHRRLHLERTRHGGALPPVLEPTRQRVSAKGDDAAVMARDGIDEGVEDAVDVRGELLGSALWAERVLHRLGERGEADDVGEQRRAALAVRKRLAVGHRLAAVGREISGERPPQIIRDGQPILPSPVSAALHWHTRSTAGASGSGRRRAISSPACTPPSRSPPDR